MAHSPIFRPASDNPQPKSARRAADSGRLEPEAVSQLARWQSILSAQGGGQVSADLALDLVLNEIVEVTRESTQANAAAIALARDGEIVCRATTGEGAPDLGTRLNTDSGLTAVCAQTGTWQRSDDTENDARVDTELCRRLGVRCILVVPVLRGEEVLGLIEIFSAQAWAFGEREVQRLQSLSRSIVENIEAAGRSTASVAPAPVSGILSEAEKRLVEASRLEPVSAEGREASDPLRDEVGKPTADFWTGALMAAVVVLAVALGWMVGRSGRQGSRVNAVRPVETRSQPRADATKNDVATSAPVEPATAGTPVVASGSGLIVYENGRMVFPQASKPVVDQRKSTATTSGVKPAAQTSKVQNGGLARIPPEVAAAMVLRRVEPEYPAGARERRVQGAVELDAVVGRDGLVEKFTGIRGDPDLAAAASEAVRQWQFKPYESDEGVEAFQTRITVVFRLP